MTALRQFRSLIYSIPLCLLATAFLVSGALLTATEDGIQMQRRLFKLWARWILWICRVRVRLNGFDALPTGGPYIFAANHVSLLDAPILIAAIPLDLCFLVKYRFIPVLELFLYRTGQIAIRRANEAEERRTLEEAAESLPNDPRSLIVFPEAHRSTDEATKFRDDPAFLAIASGRPLIPVRIEGVRAALPGKSTLIIGGTVDVYLGEPTSTEGLDPRTVTNQLRGQIAALAHSH
jgi:1-acyl-sn-glycerol-3-phosphate acyltransferase